MRRSSESPRRHLILLDANHLMHRAYWAIDRRLATSKGERTNATFGVASMLLTLLQREHPDVLIACFDEGKETLRHAAYEAYKAGRPETPEDFYTQISRVKQCFDAFSIPIASDPQYEADDLLATLASRGSVQGDRVTIITGDRDLFQLASDRVHIAVPNGGYAHPEYLDAEGVREKLGVCPEQVADYKGLTGDPSDNLRGVRGIGPKTAAELLQKYGSLEGIYAHLSEIRESVRSKLEADRESAFFCRELAQVVRDVPFSLPLLEQPWHADTAAVDQFFQEVEFHTLKRRFKGLLQEDAALRAHFTGALPESSREEGEIHEEDSRDLPDLD